MGGKGGGVEKHQSLSPVHFNNTTQAEGLRETAQRIWFVWVCRHGLCASFASCWTTPGGRGWINVERDFFPSFIVLLNIIGEVIDGNVITYWLWGLGQAINFVGTVINHNCLKLWILKHCDSGNKTMSGWQQKQCCPIVIGLSAILDLRGSIRTCKRKRESKTLVFGLWSWLKTWTDSTSISQHWPSSITHPVLTLPRSFLQISR